MDGKGTDAFKPQGSLNEDGAIWDQLDYEEALITRSGGGPSPNPVWPPWHPISPLIRQRCGALHAGPARYPTRTSTDTGRRSSAVSIRGGK